jgi:hypothetical protein
MDDDSSYFCDYFLQRAVISDRLIQEGQTADGLILATASLDALGKIWAHHFAEEASQLATAYGGGLSDSQRLAHMLKAFTRPEDNANKIAVVCFAEDWIEADPQRASFIRSSLLQHRVLDCEPRESPRSYLDLSLDDLLKQHPEIAHEPGLVRVAQEYQYGAILYRMYRCPLVHSSLPSLHTHGFARNNEASYWKPSGEKARIGFSPLLVTRWLRQVASLLAQKCMESSISACSRMDPDAEQNRRLSALWEKAIASNSSGKELKD